MNPTPAMSRRHMLKVSALAGSASLSPIVWGQSRFTLEDMVTQIGERARSLDDRSGLNILIPDGSQSNVEAIARRFTAQTGVRANLQVAPVDDINTRILLADAAGGQNLDVALAATYGVPDLAQAGVILPLDAYVERYEPREFKPLILYSAGSYYQQQFYGYQTDGDVYLMFVNTNLLEAGDLHKRIADRLGHARQTFASWAEIDTAMSLAHGLSENIFGGSLFRSVGYLLWEFWLRLHSKGIRPLGTDGTPNLTHPLAIDALNELIAASQYLEPGSATQSLFQNWDSFAEGNTLMNIGWGGSQKAFRRKMGAQADGVVCFAPPGVSSQGIPYFNWGWNYTVLSRSRRAELAYLFTLFAVSPAESTRAVRAGDGYFDPFQEAHYSDSQIRSVYSPAFLSVHKDAMHNCIPDFYLIQQGRYFAALSKSLQLAYKGRVSANEAMRLAAREWTALHQEIGWELQLSVWQDLSSKYPKPA